MTTMHVLEDQDSVKCKWCNRDLNRNKRRGWEDLEHNTFCSIKPTFPFVHEVANTAFTSDIL